MRNHGAAVWPPFFERRCKAIGPAEFLAKAARVKAKAEDGLFSSDLRLLKTELGNITRS